MTLKEIEKQIAAAKAAPVNEDGTSDYWNLLPRVAYKELPGNLKAEADKYSIERVKNLLFEYYPIDVIANISNDQESFNKKIKEALHTAVYLIESTTPPQPTGNEAIDAAALEEYSPVSLIAADLLTAWETVTGIDDKKQYAATLKSYAVKVTKLKKTDFPLDKVNRNIFNLLEANPDGQISFNIDTTNNQDKGKTDPVLINVGLNFDNLKHADITKKLEPYDKRVYLAVAALFNHKYEVVSLQQIYNTMGFKGRAGASDLKKINDSITKMNSAHLYLNNFDESKKYKNFAHFKYDSSLLPMERITATINGQETTGIHLFREPPLVTFARERKQITTVPIKLLETPISKTNQNLALEDYLLEQISFIKTGHINNKMLYQTIYEHVNITTTKQKQRAPEKIKKILEHYKQNGFIKNYDMKKAKDGIIIEF